MEINFISFGLSIQRETVTAVDAAIGRILKRLENVEKPRLQLIRMKIDGHMILAAHFLLFLCIKMSSLNMPTKFGIIPAVPPNNK